MFHPNPHQQPVNQSWNESTFSLLLRDSEIWLTSPPSPLRQQLQRPNKPSHPSLAVPCYFFRCWTTTWVTTWTSSAAAAAAAQLPLVLPAPTCPPAPTSPAAVRRGVPWSPWPVLWCCCSSKAPSTPTAWRPWRCAPCGCCTPWCAWARRCALCASGPGLGHPCFSRPQTPAHPPLKQTTRRIRCVC